jgi:hypothetical protein
MNIGSKIAITVAIALPLFIAIYFLIFKNKGTNVKDERKKEED